MRTAINPYSAAHKRKIAVASRSGMPITAGGREVPRGSFGLTTAGTPRVSGSPLVASNGEFNAGNKQEVMQAIATLYNLFNAGQIDTKYVDQDNIAEARASRQRRLDEAIADRTGQSWQALGKLCPLVA